MHILSKTPKINYQPKLDYQDVLIVPKSTKIASRNDVRLQKDMYFKHSKRDWVGVPIVSSNMDTVTNLDTFNVLRKRRMMSCFPKSFNDDFIKMDKLPRELRDTDYYMLSTGISNKDISKILHLNSIFKDKGIYIKFLCFDVANGYMTDLMNTCYKMRMLMPNVTFVAGNIVTSDGVKALLIDGLVDIVKVGIGNGCFDGNTRVLMATGIYKNIKDIKVNDYVINKDGKAVKVLKVMNQGVKPVLKISTNNWHDDTYVTNDHRYWIGDLSTSSKKAILSSGIAKLLDKQAKTKPKSSKYKWKQMGEVNKEKMFCLMPNRFEWKLAADFTIDLSAYLVRGVCDTDEITTSGNGKIKTQFKRTLHSSYKLGYLFGTFLGDGCSHVGIHRKSEKGTCKWHFGHDEMDIANRVRDYVYDLMSYECSIVIRRNRIDVCCYNKCISKMFFEFNKRDKKQLPEKYYCTNKEYIKGLLDGLVDSDGSIELINDNKISNVFTNTSQYLIELFYWCCMNLGLSFCSMKAKKTIGNLKGANIDNLKQVYLVKTHTLNRYTKDYVYSILQSAENYDDRETWDIEVDCPTHSFIANNSIVHNSLCTTRKITGVGYPQFSAVLECAETAKEYGAYLMADGGINQVGDISKALCAGGDFVMLGSMLAGHDVSPGETIHENEQLYKLVYGMSSKVANDKYFGGLKNYKAPEGKLVKMAIKGKLEDTLLRIEGGIRSTCTYIGAKDINQMPENSSFITVHKQYNDILDKYVIDE
jgi:IMP dehydrogenase/GMP reductase